MRAARFPNDRYRIGAVGLLIAGACVVRPLDALADCAVVVTPQTAEEVLTHLRTRTAGESCTLTSLRAEPDRIEARYAIGPAQREDVMRLEPVRCANPSATRVGPRFAITVSTAFERDCPATLARATSITVSLAPPTTGQAHLASRTRARAAWWTALALLAATLAIAARSLQWPPNMPQRSKGRGSTSGGDSGPDQSGVGTP